MRCGFLFLFLFSITSSVWGGEVEGRVVDENKKGVPYVVIFSDQSAMIAITDESGCYSVRLPVGNYYLSANALGFTMQRRYAEVRLDTIHVDFTLAHVNFSDRVLAGSRSVGNKMMTEVLKERAGALKQKMEDRHHVYLKAVLKTNAFGKISGINVMDKTAGNISEGFKKTGVIYYMEKQFFEYRDKDGHLYRRIQSFREAGDPQGINIQSTAVSPDFYKDRVNILGLQPDGFISPLNTDAQRYYDFSFEGVAIIDGHSIEKIKVIPRKNFEPLFSGYLYVAQSERQLCGVDLLLNRNSQANGIDTLQLKQIFRKQENGNWRPVTQVITLKVKNLWQPITGQIISVYSNQSESNPLNTPKTPKRIKIAYDPLALDQNNTYWDSVRVIPITKEERELYQFKDSLLKVKQAKRDFEIHKVQTSFTPLSLVFGYPHIRTRHDEFATRPLVNAVQFNSVEGVSGTLEFSWRHYFGADASESFYIQTLNRYSQHNRHVNSLVHFGMDYYESDWPNRSLSWQATIGQYIYQINGDNPLAPVLNEVYTLFRGLNYMKLFENQIYGVSLKRNWGFGLSGGLSLSYEKRKALVNGTNFSFIKNNDERISPNIPNGKSMMNFERATIASFSVSYQPGVDFIWYPMKMETIFPHTPKFTMDFTAGIPIANTTADFEKWRLMMMHSLPIKNAGRLDYRLAMGGFLNTREVNLPDWNHINGYRALLATPYLNSFQLADNYRYSNVAKIYEEIHLEWHLNGWLTGQLPFIKQANIHLVFGSNAFYVGPKDFYAEGFIGFENLGWGVFRYGRVDFLTGYDVDTRMPIFGARLGLFGLWEALLKTKTIRDL